MASRSEHSPSEEEEREAAVEVPTALRSPTASISPHAPPLDTEADGTIPAGARAAFAAKDFIAQFGQDVQTTLRNRFRNLQGTIHSQLRNLQDNMANLRHTKPSAGTEKHHLRMFSYDHNDLHIRSVRKLFDVIEQRYSWISILLLLLNVGLEAAAFGIYIRAQRAHVPTHWLEFDWGMGYFIAEVVLSAIFMASWAALLAVEPKRMAYAFNIRSLMSHMSCGWMLLLGFGALVTQNPAWRRVYAPMFLRLWWLHEGLLTLLSYPQISLFFTENRLEMLRSMIECIAVIGISVGILQAVESFCGDPIEYFDMVYMMLLAFSTIGYGDIVPVTVEGRLLMILFIGVGLSYFVPILEYVADLGVRHLFYAHYTTWFKRSNHIVLCGNLGFSELLIQLKNILAEDRHYLNLSVVVLLTEQPSAQVELLLNSPKYRSAVHLLVGEPSNPNDLDRCNARGASAIFLYGAGSNSSYYSDYDMAKQAMTANLHVPQTPLYVLLHRSRYTKSLMPSGANVLEFERLSHNLLGLGCVLPGMIPFIANLIRMFDPVSTEALWELSDFKDLLGLSGGEASLKAMRKMWTRKRDMLTYGAASIELGDGAEPNWTSTYEASLAQHVGTVDAPPVVQEGHYTFVSLARLLYRNNITLIGVQRPAGEDGTVVELAPHASLVGVLKLLLICDVRRKAQDIVEEILLDALLNPSAAPAPVVGSRSRHSRTKRKSSAHRRAAAAAAVAIPPIPFATAPATAVTVIPLPAIEVPQALENASVLLSSTLRPTDTAPSSPTGVTLASTPRVAAAEAGVPSGIMKPVPPVSPTSAVVLRPTRESSHIHGSSVSTAPVNAGTISSTASQPASITTTVASPTATSVVSPVSSISPTSAAAVMRRGDSVRSMRAHSTRIGPDAEVPLASAAAALALAAAEEEADELMATGPTPTVRHASPRGLRQVSSVASLSSSHRGITPPPSIQQQLQQQPTSLRVSPPAQQQQPFSNTYNDARAGTHISDSHTVPAASPAGLGPSTPGTVLLFEPDVLHLERHYVFIDLSVAHERTNWSREAAVESRSAKAADYYDAMRPVRQHDPDSDIVLLANDTNYDYLNNMWEEEDVSGSLIVVQGCGLFTSDLRRCNVAKAAAIVIFSAGDRCDAHGDALSVLVMQLVQQLIDEDKSDGAADVPVVVEVDNAELVPLFATANMTTGKNAQTSSEWVSEPSFMSGCVVCRHMLDTGLQEMYFAPLLHDVLEQLLSSKSESLLVTVMAPDASWRCYEDATTYGLDNALLPLAIHRFHEMASEDDSVSFRYIVTNPPPTFPLHHDDFIYCLKL